MVDDSNVWIGCTNIDVHRDVGHCILNRLGNTVGDAGGKACSDLEVQRISRSDWIRRAVSNRGVRSVDSTGQDRERFELLTWVEGKVRVGTQADDQCT